MAGIRHLDPYIEDGAVRKLAAAAIGKPDADPNLLLSTDRAAYTAAKAKASRKGRAMLEVNRPAMCIHRLA